MRCDCVTSWCLQFVCARSLLSVCPPARLSPSLILYLCSRSASAHTNQSHPLRVCADALQEAAHTTGELFAALRGGGEPASAPPLWIPSLLTRRAQLLGSCALSEWQVDQVKPHLLPAHVHSMRAPLRVNLSVTELSDALVLRNAGEELARGCAQLCARLRTLGTVCGEHTAWERHRDAFAFLRGSAAFLSASLTAVLHLCDTLLLDLMLVGECTPSDEVEASAPAQHGRTRLEVSVCVRFTRHVAPPPQTIFVALHDLAQRIAACASGRKDKHLVCLLELLLLDEHATGKDGDKVVGGCDASALYSKKQRLRIAHLRACLIAWVRDEF
jgi:hypothetical protein